MKAALASGASVEEAMKLAQTQVGKVISFSCFHYKINGFNCKKTQGASEIAMAALAEGASVEEVLERMEEQGASAELIAQVVRKAPNQETIEEPKLCFEGPEVCRGDRGGGGGGVRSGRSRTAAQGHGAAARPSSKHLQFYFDSRS